MQVDLTVDKFQLTNADQIHKIGTMAHIQQLEAGPGGAIAMLMAHRRVIIHDKVNLRTPPLITSVRHIDQAPLDALGAGGSDEVKATSNEILVTLRDIIKANPLFQQVRRGGRGCVCTAWQSGHVLLLRMHALVGTRASATAAVMHPS